jgi:hypothetical protein
MVPTEWLNLIGFAVPVVAIALLDRIARRRR